MPYRDRSLPWASRRLLWVRLFRNGVVVVASMAPPVMKSAACEDMPLLIQEAIVETTDEGGATGYRLTPAGRVLRALDSIAGREAGPWALNEVRKSLPKQYETSEIEEGLRALERLGIVKSEASKRGTKWDLTGQ